MQEDTFALLGACPACASQIPVARVASLADLGNFLDGQPEPTEDTRDDPGHIPTCAVAATRRQPGA